MGEAAGRVALVTGAGSPTGIGFATAAVLGREGAAVAICSTTDRIHAQAGALQATGYDAAGFVADLTDRAQVRAPRGRRADPVRAHRHPGQQRRAWSRSRIPTWRTRLVPDAHRPSLGSRYRAEPHHRLQRDQGGAAGHGGTRLGAGGHGVVGDRAGRDRPRFERLQRRQGGHGRVDAGDRDRGGRRRRHGELGRPRVDRDRLATPERGRRRRAHADRPLR